MEQKYVVAEQDPSLSPSRELGLSSSGVRMDLYSALSTAAEAARRYGTAHEVRVVTREYDSGTFAVGASRYTVDPSEVSA
jgi:hypothetical protein